jgi:hypothetical protein
LAIWHFLIDPADGPRFAGEQFYRAYPLASLAPLAGFLPPCPPPGRSTLVLAWS